jgi:hypothetical protein
MVVYVMPVRLASLILLPKSGPIMSEAGDTKHARKLEIERERELSFA